jgi:precorrin-3B synthase
MTEPALVPSGTFSGCPTATRPVAAREGLLARFCLPGGRLEAAGLMRFVAGCRDLGIGALDLTNRANIQIRGLSQAQADGVAELALACGLLPAGHAHRRRAVVASPLAGFDPGEAAGTVRLVGRLDRFFLESAKAEASSAKFGMGVDGGGAYPIRQRSLDLVLEAAPGGWRPVLAGRDTGLAVGEAAAAGVAEAVLDMMAATGAGRVKELLELTGIGPVRTALLRLPGAAEAPAMPAARTVAPPVGILDTGLDTGLGTGEEGGIALGAVVPFGVLELDAAAAAASVAERFGRGELRLSPWRGLVVPGLDRKDAPEAERLLNEAGMSTNPDTPFAIIHACPGVTGCLRAEADIRGDAAAVARALGPIDGRVRHIHVSGCGRGCAWPRRADILLLADGRNGYELRGNADAREPGDGTVLARGLLPDRVPGTVRELVEGARERNGSR